MASQSSFTGRVGWVGKNRGKWAERTGKKGYDAEISFNLKTNKKQNKKNKIKK